jgi:ketosteroid isomerase-like protein
VELLERLRATYEAFSREDFDAAAEIAHPEIELVRAGGHGSIRGAQGFRAWMEPDALEDHKVEPLDFRVNGNIVLVRQRQKARGAISGAEVDVETWAVWRFAADGRATRLEGFVDEGPALEAAGFAG